MRTVSTTAAQIISSDVREVHWVADLFLDNTRLLSDIGIAEPALSWSGGSQVAGSGSVVVVVADVNGVRITPTNVSDIFAPYGAELQLDVIMSAGKFSERVALGRFVIESVPQTISTPFSFRGQTVYPGDAFKLELRDLMHRVSRNRFVFPEGPASTSAWSEVNRLTNLPILRNVPDAVVASSVVYDEDRLKAVDSLFDAMQAWPQLTSNGVLTARPYSWPEVMDTVLTPDLVTNSLRSDNVYNRVVVEGKGAEGAVIRQVADLTYGPLRTVNPDGSPSPYGVVPYFYNSDFITDDATALNVATSMLARVSRLRGVTRTFSEPFNPLREIGDVLKLNAETVRVSDVKMSDAETELTVEVQE